MFTWLSVLLCSALCMDQMCPNGRKCKVKDGKAVCICDLVGMLAGKLNGPVCTKRHEYFPNAMSMARDACQRNINHQLDYYGKCLRKVHQAVRPIEKVETDSLSEAQAISIRHSQRCRTQFWLFCAIKVHSGTFIALFLFHGEDYITVLTSVHPKFQQLVSRFISAKNLDFKKIEDGSLK